MQGVNGEKEHAVWNWIRTLGAANGGPNPPARPARGGPKSPCASAELILDVMQGVNDEKEHAVWNWVRTLGAARGGPKSPRASAELILDEAQDIGRGRRGTQSPRTPAPADP